MKKNYIKIMLDMLMAITFALLMDPRVVNGLPFHEITGLVLGVGILTHITLNVKWIKQTTLKLFDPKLANKIKFSYLLNLLLLLSFSTIIVTGIFISRVVFPGLGWERNHLIRELHNLSANVTLGIIGIHIGLHWKWIMGIAKKIVHIKRMWVGTISLLVLIVIILQWTSMNFNAHLPAFYRHRQESPLFVILSNFFLFAMIIIPTYYVENHFLKMKKNKIKHK